MTVETRVFLPSEQPGNLEDRRLSRVHAMAKLGSYEEQLNSHRLPAMDDLNGQTDVPVYIRMSRCVYNPLTCRYQESLRSEPKLEILDIVFIDLYLNYLSQIKSI